MRVTDENVSFESDCVMRVRHRAVGEKQAVLVEIAVAQLFANDMALYRVHAPGVFRQSSKVMTARP